MASVAPVTIHPIQINLTGPEDLAVVFPQHPLLTIHLADSQTLAEHKEIVEKLSKDIIDVHIELKEFLKKVLQNGAIRIKRYALKSPKWPHQSSNEACIWDTKQRILFIKTKPDFADFVGVFVYGICMITNENSIVVHQLKSANEYARAYEKCQYDTIMLRNKFIKEGIEKYRWPNDLQIGVVTKYTSFELYFDELVKAYPTENTWSLYDQSCYYYVETMQNTFQKEFTEEIEKKVTFDQALTGDAFLKQSKLVIKGLQNQICLIEMIYKMHLERKLIEGLYKERAKLYQMQKKLKPKREALDKSRHHMEVTRNLLNDKKTDSDLQQDAEVANNLFLMDQSAYCLAVQEIQKIENTIKENEAKIIADNKPVLDDNDDRLRAISELKRIQEQLVIRNKQEYDILETQKHALTPKQNGLSAASIVPTKPKPGILMRIHADCPQLQMNLEISKQKHDLVNMKTCNPKTSK